MEELVDDGSLDFLKIPRDEITGVLTAMKRHSQNS